MREDGTEKYITDSICHSNYRRPSPFSETLGAWCILKFCSWVGHKNQCSVYLLRQLLVIKHMSISAP